MRRDRSVVDDPAAARRLVLHDPEGLLGTEEDAGEVGVDHRSPLFVRQILQGNRWRAAACIVEDEVEPAERLSRLREQRLDRCRIADIGRDSQRSEEHTSDLQSLMRISYAVFCLKKKK